MKEYDLHFTFMVKIEATEASIQEEHDRLMRRYVKALSKEFGDISYLRDCKTGRFRKVEK
jgi:hypothetical protein